MSGEWGAGEKSAREAFAGRLRELREGSGRTYAALARRIGVSGSTLHRYCTGQTVPVEFAPVERLARLCGCTGEEREALHRLWLRAEAERTERQEAGQVPGTETATATAATATATAATTATAAPSDGERPEAGSAAGAGIVTAPGRSPSVRRWVQALAVCAAAAVALVLIPAFDGPFRPSPSEPPKPPEPPEQRRSAARDEAPPFTWTTDDHVWKFGCGHAYLVDRPPAAVPPPPAEVEAAAWAARLEAVHAGETGVRVTLQGTDERAVVLEALRIRVVARRAPAQGRVHTMSSGCGGALTPRMFDVDLDAERPLARSVPGNDSGEPITAVSFPYRVSASDPEVFLVTGRAARCDCDWVAELRWSSGGRSGTARIDDDGRPFRTSGAAGRPVREYDFAAGRWVPGESAALPSPGPG